MQRQDDEPNGEQKLPLRVRDAGRGGLDFPRSLHERSFGCNGGTIRLRACAEDELVKKEFKEMRCEMPGLPRSTFLMVFSPDGTKMASTHGNHHIYVTDVRTGKHIKTLVGHPRTPWCIAFHPTSNQIIASGCLGGQVRVWDLSGGSEVWTVDSQTVIASIAFHPDPIGRLVVVATYNGIYFWDWSKPKPYMHVATGSAKEKVRYVAFDRLGHKLITGITNSPQIRWERVRAPVPIMRPSIPTASQYRRRITPRLITTLTPSVQPENNLQTTSAPSTSREPLSSVPERERRITTCYRDLVQQYTVLVQRYLQMYRPPVMIDQGTDPMEVDRNNAASSQAPSPVPSTSGLNMLRKSSATQPAKNKPRSSGESAVQRTATSTQTTVSAGDSISASLSSSLHNAPSPPVFRIPGLEDSSSEEEEHSLQDIINNFENRYRIIRLLTDAMTTMTSSTSPGQSTPVYRNVNLARTKVTMTKNFVVPITSSTSSSQTRLPPQSEQTQTPPAPSTSTPPSTSSGSQEQTYKMRIKYSIAPQSEGASGSSGEADTATPSTSTQTNENISDLIRKAEIMLARFRENLEQKGIDLSSTSCRLPGMSAGHNPSKGTSTENIPPAANHSEPQPQQEPRQQKPQRRRLYRRPELTTCSSDSSSSDDEPDRKRRRESNEHTYAAAAKPSTSEVVNLTDEHSYAGTLDPATPSTSSQDGRVKIKINVSSVDEEQTAKPEQPQQQHKPQPINFRAELELLLMDDRDGQSEESARNRICGTCGGSVNGGRQEASTSSTPTCSQVCTLSTPSTSASPTESRRRFLSHRLSAFHPTRLNVQCTLNRPRMNRLRYPDSPPARSNSFAAPDEVVNYAERVNEEEPTRAYHPFDPPPELMSINPENIGIGNMYSNIVQELESSLNDVRNIRANRRPGETSDMLSSFSERLESIMNQSNAIMRNLSSSLESLPTSDSEGPIRRYPEDSVYTALHSSAADVRRIVFGNNNNPVTSDHTYPLNPESPHANRMSPLMLSLHLTVSHIQRQARLLRQQVESIERIDRAMLEVAQLQQMRQMFDELHRHLSNSGGDGRAGVSSVRLLMAGTRITDEATTSAEAEPQASTSTAATPPPPPSEEPSTSGRSRTRKTYPRCLFLMHRQFRRSNNLIGGVRRCGGLRRYENTGGVHDRIGKDHRRFFDKNHPYTPWRPQLTGFDSDALNLMTTRLEHFLMEHGRFIGRSMANGSSGTTSQADGGEQRLKATLRNCRRKINRIMGVNEDANNINLVTQDGSSRFGARDTLGTILYNLAYFMISNSSLNTSNLRSHIWEVIELSLLLSEILLLQIIDSIPPPSGMNLDPERESLSWRIDQMCRRMLQSRLSGQSRQLARSLRLLRLTVRHATHTLGQTYTARRNALLPSNGDNEHLDSRQELLDDIVNCLRNIRRHRENSDGGADPVASEWYRTINNLINRYTSSPLTESQPNLNSETGEPSNATTAAADDPNSSDDNASSNTTTRISPPLYRTSNVNLLANDESSPSGNRHRMWNVPTVAINDVPISEPQHSPWHSNFIANRQRLSDELRANNGLFRPRFLHPLYPGISPFVDDFDDPHREQLYDSDIITVTPNHRIQVWEFKHGIVPNISNAVKNVVVTECKIHNDASVDYASDGSILVTLLPSGSYMHLTNRLGVYSLEWETLGQCLYQTSFEQNAVSVSLSPMNRHLVVGLASRRTPIVSSDKWTMAHIFVLDEKEAPYGKLSPIRELEQNRDTSYISVNCIRWLPSSGQGLVFATNTGHLRFLT